MVFVQYSMLQIVVAVQYPTAILETSRGAVKINHRTSLIELSSGKYIKTLPETGSDSKSKVPMEQKGSSPSFY